MCFIGWGSFGSFKFYRQPPTVLAEGVPPVRLSPDDGGAIGIGYSARLLIGGDAVQDPQEIAASVSAVQQSRGNFKSHESWC